MCGLFDTPEAPKVTAPPPEPPPPVFQAGSEKDTGYGDSNPKKDKDSLKNKAVGLGIPSKG